MSNRPGSFFFTNLTLWLPAAPFSLSLGVEGAALSSGVEPLVELLTGIEPVMEEVGGAGGGLERSGRVKVPAGVARGVEPLVIEAMS